MSLVERMKESMVKSEETPTYQVPQDKRFKELEQLLKETNELNSLMKSYIRVHMDKDGTSQMTIDHELSKIRKTSEDIQNKMISILQKLDESQKNYANQLLTHMENGRKEMTANNQQTLEKMGQIEGTLNKSLKEITARMNENMKGIENRAMSLIGKIRKGVLINDGLDVLKYGFGSLIFNVPVLVLLYYFFVK
ncbi:hypothetical protein EAI26_10770 [Lactobacillus sp. 0.1XD8-4]|nr:hypothetical protein [Lactobacillus sp. 0.1XD8-4]